MLLQSQPEAAAQLLKEAEAFVQVRWQKYEQMAKEGE
jgi:hypothetical protein